MSKPKIIKDYEKLPEEVVEQIKLVYPLGFSQHLVSYHTKEGEKKMALPFETEDFHYLVRMTIVKAQNIIENDDDYDDDGMLKQGVKKQYEDKYEDLDFLDDFNSNEDNDLGLDDMVDPSSEEDDDDDI